MWCVIHKSGTEIYHLAWQHPVFLEDDGYFWTNKDTFAECLFNNTEEHPFLFNNKAEAEKHMRSIGIKQKYSIVRWTA